MKRNTNARNFTIAAAAALAMGFGPTAKADDKGCTNATLKGAFAYTATGIITVPALAGPFAEVGLQTFDGKGGTTATAIGSQNGNILNLTITGTYTVNPDCTGILTLTAAPIGVTIHVYFVIGAGVNELQALETEQGLVVSRIYRRQFPVGDIRN